MNGMLKWRPNKKSLLGNTYREREQLLHSTTTIARFYTPKTLQRHGLDVNMVWLLLLDACSCCCRKNSLKPNSLLQLKSAIKFQNLFGLSCKFWFALCICSPYVRMNYGFLGTIGCYCCCCRRWCMYVTVVGAPCVDVVCLCVCVRFFSSFFKFMHFYSNQASHYVHSP